MPRLGLVRKNNYLSYKARILFVAGVMILVGLATSVIGRAGDERHKGLPACLFWTAMSI